jgi:uncharacterized GH25 family protein
VIGGSNNRAEHYWATAHDYWLEPASFFLQPKQSVALRLYVGDHFAGETERPFQAKPTLTFQLIGGKETVDLKKAGVEGKTPIAHLTPQLPGTYVIRLDRGPQLIKLSADKFNHYLEEEGLHTILKMRREAGEDKKEGREVYSRCIKSLLQVGDERDTTWKDVLGQKLEIVPLANPYGLKAGSSLPVRIDFDGKPLTGVRLFAHRRTAGKVETQTTVTSQEGLATIKLDGAGEWLLRLVHMRRCRDNAAADWESFWASFSFGLR